MNPRSLPAFSGGDILFPYLEIAPSLEGRITRADYLFGETLASKLGALDILEGQDYGTYSFTSDLLQLKHAFR